MKTDRIIIILAFILIGLLMALVFCCAYRPIFSGPISTEHADWEAFGDFFWGLGTMLFTALSVWMLYFVNLQLRKNQEQQQIQQEKFQTRLEEERRKLLEEIIRKKRIEDLLASYHQIILKLTGPALKSDADWFNLLRELTVTFKAIVAEQDNFPQDTLNKINIINEEIKKVIIQSYSIVDNSSEGLKMAIINVSLNREIVDLYFELLALNKVSLDIDFLFKEKEEGKKKKK